MNKKLIAVYGTLRKGFGNHRLLVNADYIGEFKTPPVYNLHNLGGFPGLKNGGNTSVVMEVYAVNEEEGRRVDALEGYTPGQTPYFYDKEMIETPFGEAGVYTYVRQLGENSLIPSGDYYLEINGRASTEHEVAVEN